MAIIIRNILKKRENVPPLHCDGVPYVTLVNADEDIMLMLLVIMLSFYFCEIFLKQWPTTPAPSAPGPSDQPFPLQGLSDARFPSSPHTHSHPHQSVVQVLRRRQRWQLREWSCRTTWSKSWSTSPSAPSAGRFADNLWMVWDWEGGTKQKIFVIFDVVYIDWFALWFIALQALLGIVHVVVLAEKV